MKVVTEEKPNGKHTLRRLAWACSYGLLAAFLTLQWVTSIEGDTAVNDPRFIAGNFSVMVDGTARNPFACRSLVPAVINTASALTPTVLRDALHRFFFSANDSDAHRLRQVLIGQEPRLITEYFWFLVVTFLSVFGFLFAIQRLYSTLFKGGDWEASLAPLLAGLTLPAFFQVGTHFVYDPAVLLLSTLCFCAVANKSWLSYYPLYFLALLNKETAVILVLVFAIVHSRSPRPWLMRHLAVQLALFAATRAVLTWWFRDRPGSFIEWHVEENLRALLSPPTLPVLVSAAVVAVAVLRQLGRRPLVLRAGLAALVPLTVAYVFSGIVGEIRVFYDVFAPVFVLAYVSALEAIGVEAAPLDVRHTV